MTHLEKIEELKEIIERTLTPLIDSNYVLLDIPYYSNLGDTLIWEGTNIFLKKIKYKCLYQTDIYNYNNQDFSLDVIILLQGGGNFGDLWVSHNDFRKKIIERHPNNKIIVLPQTVHYDCVENLKKDAVFYSKYNNVTICTRDSVSYEIIKSNFKNQVLLLPDMAFFIDAKKYSRGEQKGRTLFLKRNDKELKCKETPSIIPVDSDILDWPDPTKTRKYYWFVKVRSLFRRVDKYAKTRFRSPIIDLYWRKILKYHYVRIAVRFLDRYDLIYTTRLHVCILSVMLGKNIKVLDNSYGKNSSFYKAWLTNVENVEFID